MPEGPEVRRYADRLHAALAGRPLVAVGARTRAARAWLAAHGGELPGRCVREVRSHGKHLVGRIEGGYFFHAHLMMWGRWLLCAPDDPAVLAPDRRERARLVTGDCAALLYNAPIFEIGCADPYAATPLLQTLGPDALPYPDAPPFDAEAFLAALARPEHAERPIGALLLDQRFLAGLGNYLRAEILYRCRIDPWRPAAALTAAERRCLAEQTPALTRRAYDTGGVTLDEADRLRMAADPGLAYAPGKPGGLRHYAFRRTNLPCLRCGAAIRQRRQVTHADEEGERTRIIYYCPRCQGVPD